MMDDRRIKVTDIFENKTLGKAICMEFIDDEQRIDVLGAGSEFGEQIDRDFEIEGCKIKLIKYVKFINLFGEYRKFHYGIKYLDLDENNKLETKWNEGKEKYEASKNT